MNGGTQDDQSLSISSQFDRLWAWNTRKLMKRELYALDDRLLRDVGIEPGRIDQFVDAVERARRNGDMPPVLRQIRNR